MGKRQGISIRSADPIQLGQFGLIGHFPALVGHLFEAGCVHLFGGGGDLNCLPPNFSWSSGDGRCDYLVDASTYFE